MAEKKLYLKINRILTKLGKGRHQLTIAELDDFIKVHTEIPANPDTPYIVKSEKAFRRISIKLAVRQHECEFSDDCQSALEATCSPSNPSGFHS